MALNQRHKDEARRQATAVAGTATGPEQVFRELLLHSFCVVPRTGSGRGVETGEWGGGWRG